MDNIPPAVQLSEASYGFLAALQVLGLPHAWTVLLVRVGLYFLMTPFKQCFITISRAFLRVYTRFLSYVLSGSREWEKFFIVLDILL